MMSHLPAFAVSSAGLTWRLRRIQPTPGYHCAGSGVLGVRSVHRHVPRVRGAHTWTGGTGVETRRIRNEAPAWVAGQPSPSGSGFFVPLRDVLASRRRWKVRIGPVAPAFGSDPRVPSASLHEGKMDVWGPGTVPSPSVDKLIEEGLVEVILDPDRRNAYYVIGTSHVSTKSPNQTRDLIRAVRPDAVVLELCPQRAVRMLLLTPEEDREITARINISVRDLATAVKRDGVKGFLATSLRLLYRLFSRRPGVTPGAEFVTAAEEGTRCGAVIVLGDRPIDITMERLSRFFKRVGIPTLVGLQGLGILADYTLEPHPFVASTTTGQALFSWLTTADGVVEAANASEHSETMLRAGTVLLDVVVSIATLPVTIGAAVLLVSLVPERVVDFGMKMGRSGVKPPLPRVLVGERDKFLVWSIRNHPVVPKHNSRVVVVVGAAHLQGIVQHFHDDIDLKALIDDPKASEWDKLEARRALEEADRAAHELLKERQERMRAMDTSVSTRLDN